MKAFIIKEGVEVVAKKFDGNYEKKVMKKEVMYFDEDIISDPVSAYNNKVNECYDGKYHIKLPDNKKGYLSIIVDFHLVDVY